MDSKTSEKYTIGILGYGFVGKVMKQYYPDATVYDISGEGDKLEDVLNKDVIFIAFNLKNNAIDGTGPIEEYMAKAPDNRIFIIKSTFVPGTTDKLQDQFPQHRIIYNPEFLTEATAWWDFTRPTMQILGIPHIGLKLASEIFELLPEAPVKRIVSPKDAELLKHATNSFYATKVIFFNQLYDIAKELNSDYETVREIMTHDPRVGDSHSVVMHKGYRGFGDQTVSKCLPKDIEALSKVAHSELLDKVIEINNKLFSQR